MLAAYERYLLPRLMDRVMSYGPLADYRKRTVSRAAGRVLEVGVGSGINLSFYGSGVRELVGVDPSAPLLARARIRAQQLGLPGTLIEGSAEALPFDSSSFDTVVVTWSLCSIPHPARALSEVHRVLRPAGQLRFVEHGRSPDARVAAWQDRLTPLWSRFSGGCHLNRSPEELLHRTGFQLGQVSAGYLEHRSLRLLAPLDGSGSLSSRWGPRPFTWMIEGTAQPV
jgi:ubiquinone/menaquinone biosynthesis C-methylase UbiE